VVKGKGQGQGPKRRRARQAYIRPVGLLIPHTYGVRKLNWICDVPQYLQGNPYIQAHLCIRNHGANEGQRIRRTKGRLYFGEGRVGITTISLSQHGITDICTLLCSLIKRVIHARNQLVYTRATAAE